jgi:hypothetical protein
MYFGPQRYVSFHHSSTQQSNQNVYTYRHILEYTILRCALYGLVYICINSMHSVHCLYFINMRLSVLRLFDIEKTSMKSWILYSALQNDRDPQGLNVPDSPVIQPPSPITPLTRSTCIPFLIPLLTIPVALTAHSTPALIVLCLVPLASSRYIRIRFLVYSDSFPTRTHSDINCTNCT